MLACAALCGAAACRDFTIDAGRVIVIEIANTAPKVQQGDTLRLSARLLNAAGNPVPGASARWMIADTLPGFTLDSMTGLVTATTPGTWRVFAKFENLRTDPLNLTVTAIPTPAGGVPRLRNRRFGP